MIQVSSGGARPPAGADAGKDKSVDETALFLRNPAGHELIRRRVHDGFGDAE